MLGALRPVERVSSALVGLETRSRIGIRDGCRGLGLRSRAERWMFAGLATSGEPGEGAGMFFTTDTTAALAHARNDKLDLAAAKAGRETKAADDKIGGLLESLAAVIPTGIVAIYTLFATAARTEMLQRGADERSAFQTAMEKGTNLPTAAELAARLDGMPLESNDLVGLRWVLLGLAALVAVVLAYQAVRKGDQKAEQRRPIWRLSLEPLTALVALLAWALAAPGTPLGAYLSAEDLNFASIAIATAAGLVVLGLGTKLSEPAKTG